MGRRRALARRQAGRLHPRLEPVGPRRRHGPGAPADHGRREVLRLRHRQRRLEQQRPRHRALVARLEEDRHLPAGRARGRRDVPRQHAGQPGRRTPRFACRSSRCPATRSWRCSTASSSTSDSGTRRPLPDAARLPPRHARRQREPARLAVEAGRRRAGVHLDVARPQGGGAARGRRRHRGRPHGDGARRSRRSTSRGSAARCCGPRNEVHLVLRARQLGPPLSLRPRDRHAEAPDHQRATAR